MMQNGTPHPIDFVPNFVKKLLAILTDKPNSTSVKWMQDGNGFKILNEQKFTSQILPKYYRHANMPSFVRQLNMYGFHKIKDGEENFYKHPCFKKDQPELYSSISRKPEKKTSPPETPNHTEKQNIPEERQEEKVKKKKKVTFMGNVPQSMDSGSVKKIFRTKKELISNVSLKYDLTNKRENTLLEIGESSYDAPWLRRNCDEALSICDHLSEPEDRRDHQFFQTTKKIIFWTPSQILSNLNPE